VALTDAPACGFDQVNVTVDRVRVHMSSSASDSDSGWNDIVVSPPRTIDLLSLQNGVLTELGQTTLAAGQYTQIRLVLIAGGNTVVPTNGSATPMDTPSAMQSGLKLINGFTVQPNTLTDIVLDFDACKSVVRRGNGSYMLKPVMAMMPRSGGAIDGFVAAGVTGVTVSAQKNGVILRATQPNASGQFVLAPVDPSKAPYDVVFTGLDKTTTVITGVPVTLGQTTTLSAVSNAVTMPPSTSGAVSGRLGPAVAAAAAGSVRALQQVGTVPAVEVAHTYVDSTTGDYSLSLPLAAPRLLTYANPIVNPLPFLAQSGNAAKYKLEASATGYVSQTGTEITAPATGQNFTLVAAP
jgi:hypothetical protein